MDKELQKEVMDMINAYAKEVILKPQDDLSVEQKTAMEQWLFFEIYRKFCVYFKIKEEDNGK